jgi:hypothetical protein
LEESENEEAAGTPPGNGGTERRKRLEAKGNAMATYFTLINFTDQGVKNVKDTANRASHYKELAAKLGCTIKDIWWTQGQYDVVSIIEAVLMAWGSPIYPGRARLIMQANGTRFIGFGIERPNETSIRGTPKPESTHCLYRHTPALAPRRHQISWIPRALSRVGNAPAAPPKRLCP